MRSTMKFEVCYLPGISNQTFSKGEIEFLIMFFGVLPDSSETLLKLCLKSAIWTFFPLNGGKAGISDQLEDILLFLN